MRINRADLKRAYDALVFMSVVEASRGNARAWNELASAVDTALHAVSECGEQHVDAVHGYELAAHAAEIAHAMHEHWITWAELGRTVAARRGWISKEHREEFGNAGREALAIREAAEFLHAALAAVSHLRAA